MQFATLISANLAAICSMLAPGIFAATTTTLLHPRSYSDVREPPSNYHRPRTFRPTSGRGAGYAFANPPQGFGQFWSTQTNFGGNYGMRPRIQSPRKAQVIYEAYGGRKVQKVERKKVQSGHNSNKGKKKKSKPVKVSHQKHQQQKQQQNHKERPQVSRGKYNYKAKQKDQIDFSLQLMLDIVNEERAKAPYKAPPLRLNDKLIAAAKIQSDHQMAVRDMTHNGPSGITQLGQRLDYVKYQGGAWAENIAGERVSCRKIMDGWMASPCHRANLLNPAYSDFGVAVTVKYWTQVFATPNYLTPAQKSNPNQGDCPTQKNYYSNSPFGF